MVLSLLLLICSCSTGTDINEKNADGSPIWVTEIPKSSKVLYGVGRSKLTLDYNSQQAADAAARSDLALKIEVNMKNALSLYTNDTSSVVTSAYETLIKQSVNLTMKKVVVEQRWKSDDGTVWSIVSFKIKELPNLYKDAANDYLNQLEERRISTQKKLVDLLAQLGDSTEKDVLEIKDLAQKKADSIFSEVAEIKDSLDVESQMDLIVDYLVKNGFDISN